MNILFVTTHLNAGGITSYLLTLSKEYIKLGHNVYIASSGGNMVGEFYRAGVNHLTANIRTKSEIDPRIYFALGNLSQFIKRHSIDVIHSQTRVAQVIGQALKLLTDRPYVSTCHGFFKPRWFRRILPCWGDAVVAISPQVEEHLQKDFLVDPQKICLVMHGLDIDDFPLIPSAEKEERLRQSYISGHPVIGIIARLSDVKGHEVLVRAMPKVLEKFPAAKLVIVGEGKTGLALQNLVRHLELDDRVLFYSAVNATMKFLPLFDLFVMPSLQEGLGLSVMEAQAAGLAVVASRVGGLPSLIESGKTGVLVESNNSDALATAIMDVLADPQKAKAMGMAARESIRQNHSAEKMAKETLAVYQTLLDRHQHAREG